ncbi:MAG: ATP-binding protein [Simkaniaceae bacterium]|nr:ATP-binding protein [Simkaniaceae bacterium]
MKRTRLAFLTDWIHSTSRKPLVIRGARQVGKTWLVRHLAEQQKKQLIEINLEKRPDLSSLFHSNDPRQILLHLGAAFNLSIDPKTSLLFLDEIQTTPELIAKLRWFAEDLPDLPVIAAGSLLEFALSEHTFSMPVGRINYMYLEPLSFEEFLLATGKESLFTYLSTYQITGAIPETLHKESMTSFKEYLIVGGMPAAVANWKENRSLTAVNQVHHDVIATYRDDFAKYGSRMTTKKLDIVMMSIPRCLGQKFIYSRVDTALQTPTIKQSLDLICKARICHKVLGCASNGVPLGAEVQEKHLKMIFLDVGLASATLGLSLNELYETEELIFINKGGLAEQVVGQCLRTTEPPYIEPSLYYWHREEKGSSAEMDYIISHGNRVISLEVKAGSAGSLKSLHLFMTLKHLSLAVRVNSDLPSQTLVKVKDAEEYTLLSIPFYLVGQIHRLLHDNFKGVDGTPQKPLSYGD